MCRWIMIVTSFAVLAFPGVRAQCVLHVSFEEGQGPACGDPTLEYLSDHGQWHRRFAHLDARRLNALWNNARSKRSVSDPNLEFSFVLDDGRNAVDVSDLLRTVPGVKRVAPMSLAAPLPGWSSPPDFTPSQREFSFIEGLAVEPVRDFAGGDGGGVSIFDIEFSWNFDHDDLPVAVNVGPVPVDPFGDDNHGTAVLGILAALDDSVGVRGGATGASVHVSPASTVFGIDPAGAILAALVNANFGDVILVELQAFGPTGYVPIEWDLAAYNAIVMAVANGVIVVEVAGNGGINLDQPLYQAGILGHRPFTPGFESGAIIVGAGAVSGGFYVERSRLGFSTYGARVDVQGPGELVVTTGFGDLFGANADELYTQFFGGTSSASAVVAAGIAVLQGIHEQEVGFRLDPAAMRALLVATGRPQTAGIWPATQNIGPRPDIAAAVATFRPGPIVGALTPDEVVEAAGAPTVDIAGHGFAVGGTGLVDGIPQVTSVHSPTSATVDLTTSHVADDGVLSVSFDDGSVVSNSVSLAVVEPFMGPGANGIELLHVNGGAGGAERRVDVAAFSGFTISMGQPVGMASPAPFAIFGQIGSPDPSYVFQTPFVTGITALPPCPASPSNPSLFTLVSSFAGLPCGSVLAPGVTPWSFVAPGLPPYRFVLAGLVESVPGMLEFTNGLVVDIE